MEWGKSDEEDDSELEEFYQNLKKAKEAEADRVEIKKEPEEYDEHNASKKTVPVEPSPSIRIKEEPLDDEEITPSYHRQTSAPKPKGLTKEKTDYNHMKAKDIQEREKKKPNDIFYANVPRHLKAKTPHSTASPLTVSSFNSQHSFQATIDNVKQVAMLNPHSHLPLSVQQTGARIGANMTHFKIKDKRIEKIPNPLEGRKSPVDAPLIPSAASLQSRMPPKAEVVSPPAPPQRQQISTKRVEIKNAETQTTKNDGTLRFELNDEQLRDLTKEQQRILVEFKRAFKIVDDRDLKALEERNQHRASSRHFNDNHRRSGSENSHRSSSRRRSESEDDRRNDHRNYRRDQKESPPAKKNKQVYYNPPP